MTTIEGSLEPLCRLMNDFQKAKISKKRCFLEIFAF
jgi:hypothetical protein